MRPLILIAPDVVEQGSEFPDPALNLALRYPAALAAAGALPLTLAPIPDPSLIRQAVARCDGVLLTGGDDIRPELHSPQADPTLRSRVHLAVDPRDLLETILLDEVLRQNRPLLAICRGQQIVNVALGGDLYLDLPSERPDGLVHPRLDARLELVHEIDLEPDSALARITGRTRLGVNSTHHQAVQRVAPPLRATGHAPDGTVEALEWHPAHARDRAFLLTVQFHPERLCDRHPEHARIFRAFVDAAASRDRAPHSLG
jgi:putative glutamine amidotransferase